jgi:hypothetical protein
MDFRRILLLSIGFILTSLISVQAQTPDTTTLKVKGSRLPSTIVKLKNGNQEYGFMVYHFPYSPEKEVTLIPSDGNRKKAITYKIEDIESISYPDLRYIQIFPDNDRLEYLAREAVNGEINLYTFTERNNAPAVIPVSGVFRVIPIPYDQSYFFIEKDSKIFKINRAKYQEELLAYVGSNKELAEKIKTKTYKYKDIETIVKEYNASVIKP